MPPVIWDDTKFESNTPKAYDCGSISRVLNRVLLGCDEWKYNSNFEYGTKFFDF
jgi:hypothetical protein